ncbi:MAG: ribose-5-phosphate isomerase RpiA [Pseudomonadota bacterium]
MSANISAGERAKKAAAAEALKYVADGMRVGLGTGSTAAWLVKLLGERARKHNFAITCVPTSTRTADLARECGLKIASLDEAGWLDLTIDGADEFDPDLNLIKGGGGALLQEKIVATASDQMVVITDPSKEVPQLGAFPLPVEIIKFGWETTKTIIENMLEGEDVAGRQATLRLNREEPFVTDEGHYIVDLHLRRIGEPAKISAMLNRIPGVVENGLFINVADAIVIGREDGSAEIVERDGAAPRPAEDIAPSDDDVNIFDDIE